MIGIYDAGRNVVLDYYFSNAADPRSAATLLAHRDAAIDDLANSYTLSSDWTDPARMYTTLRAWREVEGPTDDDLPTRYYWVSESFSDKLVQRYAVEAEAVIGLAVARLLVGRTYRVAGPVYEHCPQFFVVADGRMPSPTYRINLSATATVTRAAWEQVTDIIRKQPLTTTQGFKMEKAIGEIGRTYLMALNEKDSFMRFMWAYMGLEFISGQVAKIARDDLTARLVLNNEEAIVPLGKAVISELLWPPDVQNQDPNRSVRFRFAVSATVLDPERAAADVENFARLNAYRNQIHGTLGTATIPPAAEAFNFLEKYTISAVQYLASS